MKKSIDAGEAGSICSRVSSPSSQKCVEVISHPKALLGEAEKRKVPLPTVPLLGIQNFLDLAYHAQVGAHFILVYQNSKCILRPFKVVSDTEPWWLIKIRESPLGKGDTCTICSLPTSPRQVTY